MASACATALGPSCRSSPRGALLLLPLRAHARSLLLLVLMLGGALASHLLLPLVCRVLPSLLLQLLLLTVELLRSAPLPPRPSLLVPPLLTPSLRPPSLHSLCCRPRRKQPLLLLLPPQKLAARAARASLGVLVPRAVLEGL